MGLSERKEREKEEMKARILDAAKKLFLEQGFEKTSIRNIADLIEYSPGTIYLYFKDKNELLFQLHVVAFEALVMELSSINLASNAIDRLEEMGYRYINFAFENPELYELMFVMKAPMENLECSNDVWEDGMRAFDMLRFLIADCKNAGFFGEYEIDDASLMVWSFVHGLVTLKSHRRLEMFGETEEDSLARMMRAFAVFMSQIKCTVVNN